MVQLTRGQFFSSKEQANISSLDCSIQVSVYLFVCLFVCTCKLRIVLWVKPKRPTKLTNSNWNENNNNNKNKQTNSQSNPPINQLVWHAIDRGPLVKLNWPVAATSSDKTKASQVEVNWLQAVVADGAAAAAAAPIKFELNGTSLNYLASSSSALFHPQAVKCIVSNVLGTSESLPLELFAVQQQDETFSSSSSSSDGEYISF